MNALYDRIMTAIRGFLIHVFTGADNSTIAIGRVMAVPYALVGWVLPYVMMVGHQAFTLGEAGIFLAAHAGGIPLLVTGTNPTEPKVAPVSDTAP